MADIELIVKIDANVYTRLFDNDIQDNEIATDDICEMARALRLGKPLPKCKDCKWWKDGDGAFRRGIGAESKCPMNRIEVFEGKGYCFLYEPHERSEKE